MKNKLDRALQAGIYLCVFLLGYFLISAAGTLLHLRQVSARAAAEETDKYEIRSRLLMDATDQTGACAPDMAAEVWAEGLLRRSAALQYTVMTKEMKDSYARQLETTFPNWVTGVSSPWVADYAFNGEEKTGAEEYRYRLKFSTATSAGPAGEYNATLTVRAEGEFWRITKIEADRELNVYTGFE